MCQTLCQVASYTLSDLVFVTTFMTKTALVSFILKGRKLRHRKVEQLTQDHTESTGARIQHRQPSSTLLSLKVNHLLVVGFEQGTQSLYASLAKW